MAPERLIELLETQLTLEKEAARALRKEMNDIDHLGIKVLFEICAADSTKHATMVQMLLDALKKEKPTPSDSDEKTYMSTWRQRNQGLEAIKQHINREEKMIELIKDEILATDDQVLKAILEHIVKDEERHHKILKEEIWEF
ncbi:MAG: ferritin family protein [Candidatus Thorarchaeota archaeon]